MLKKVFNSQAKEAEQILRNIKLTSDTSQEPTELARFVNLSTKFNPHCPSMSIVFRVIKKQEFTLDYLLKCTVLAHFYIDQSLKKEEEKLTQYISFLHRQWEGHVQMYQSGQSSSSFNLFNTNNTLSTQTEETINAKQIFFLKQIVRPYLSYLQKLNWIKNEQPEGETNLNSIWRFVNLLKLLSGISLNFPLIGRYYKHSYGNLVVLMSEIMSIDIQSYVNTVSQYLLSNYKLLSPSSHKIEDIQEVYQFISLLEEMGHLNQRFSQMYLGKYFYQGLIHLQRPIWKDNNSIEFQHLFKKSYRRRMF